MFFYSWIVFSQLGLQTVQTIDCFKCVSYNNEYIPCEDPFHNNSTTEIFESPCMGGRRGRDGLYPATSCVKISGTFDGSDETIMIRSCALDSGTLTTDTELVRMSHCGGFYYDNKYVHGCVQTCNDADACNNSNSGQRSHFVIYFLYVKFLYTCSITNELIIV